MNNGLIFIVVFGIGIFLIALTYAEDSYIWTTPPTVCHTNWTNISIYANITSDDILWEDTGGYLQPKAAVSQDIIAESYIIKDALGNRAVFYSNAGTATLTTVSNAPWMINSGTGKIYMFAGGMTSGNPLYYNLSGHINTYDPRAINDPLYQYKNYTCSINGTDISVNDTEIHGNLTIDYDIICPSHDCRIIGEPKKMSFKLLYPYGYYSQLLHYFPVQSEYMTEDMNITRITTVASASNQNPLNISVGYANATIGYPGFEHQINYATTNGTYDSGEISIIVPAGKAIYAFMVTAPDADYTFFDFGMEYELI